MKNEIKNKLQKQVNRIRKVAKQRYDYDLPDYDNRYLLDAEYLEDEKESSQNWLDSLGKSQYNITESLVVASW